MGQRLPPLPWLRAFEASARHLSFTSAAQELHLTQAAISKQVKLLEHYLREPLFQRKPRSLVLTKVGAAYLPKVRDAFERLATSTQEIFGNSRTEVLTLRAVTGFSVNWIASRLPGFIEQYPKIKFRIVSSIWSEEIDKERFDLDIRYGQGKWPGFNSSRLTWETLEPLCSLEMARKLNSPDDLMHENLLHVLGYEEGWAIWLRQAGVTTVDPGQGWHVDNSLLAFELSATGVGIALGRSSMSEKEVNSGRLIRPFAFRAPVREAFHLLSASDGQEHPDTGYLRDWLINEAALAKDNTHPDA